jgi:YbbR domain-containing protein
MKLILKTLRNRRGSVPFWESFALKVVSFLLALILWVTFLGLKHEEIHKRVKLEPMLAPGTMITNKIPSHIDFTLTGPRLLLKSVDRKINPIRPDFRRNRESTIGFTISEELLGGLPKEVRVVAFNPTSVLIRLEEVVERYLPVSPTLRGSTLAGYEISGIETTPTKVAVTGPKGVLNRVDSVGTEPIDIEGLTGVKELEVPVEVNTDQGFSLSRENVVKVRIKVRKVSR